MKRIHLIGICGTAMATLAALLKNKGYDVRGSDQNVYPPMSDFLEQQGITTLQGYGPEHIAAELDLCPATVCTWLKPFSRRGLGGLREATRPGRPATLHAFLPPGLCSGRSASCEPFRASA